MYHIAGKLGFALFQQTCAVFRLFNMESNKKKKLIIAQDLYFAACSCTANCFLTLLLCFDLYRAERQFLNKQGRARVAVKMSFCFTASLVHTKIT